MKIPSWDTKKAMALYNEGKTDRQIAEAVFVSAGVIGTWRRKQGLPAQRDAQKKRGAEKALSPPVSPPTAMEPLASAPSPTAAQLPPLLNVTGPVALSVELNGCSFALRAPDMKAAAWAYEYAGRLLEDMTKAAELVKEAESDD